MNAKDNPDFAALAPVMEWMDDAEAHDLCVRVEERCARLTNMIRFPGDFYEAIAAADTQTLVIEHGFMDALREALVQTGAVLPLAAVPHVAGLRDAIAAEGLRRGYVFHAGNLVDDRSLATCVAMQLAGPIREGGHG